MRIVLGVLAAVALAAGTVAAAVPTPTTSGDSETTYKLGDSGVTAPVVVHQGRPRYYPPAGAKESYLVAELDVVVLATGKVGDVTVTKSSGNAKFDEAAVVAAKQSTFKPGKVKGKDVAVMVTMEMTFMQKR